MGKLFTLKKNQVVLRSSSCFIELDYGWNILMITIYLFLCFFSFFFFLFEVTLVKFAELISLIIVLCTLEIYIFLCGVNAVLLWMLTAACIKTGRPQIARRAIDLAETRLLKDGWPEYYDGKVGRFIGKQARKYQTWSIAGYLVAKMMLEDPSHLGMISLEEDKQMKPVIKRSTSWTC